MLWILIIVGSLLTKAAVPDDVLQQWLKIPEGVPDNINDETELSQYIKAPYVSAILKGGLGNVMFQMASALALAHSRHVNCVIAQWNQAHDDAFGSRTPPAPGITLKHLFPRIVYVDFLPHFSPAAWMVIPPSPFPPKTMRSVNFFDSYQMDLKCESNCFTQYERWCYVSPDFHAEREYLVNDAFAWHPAMESYIDAKYGHILRGALQTVSVHFRLGGVEEPQQGDFGAKSRYVFPRATWYRHVLATYFPHETHHYMLFADNVPLMVRDFLEPLMLEINATVTIVTEDMANAMLLMSRCQHHIAALSSFSFWGIYLDRKQPTGGLTIFPDTWGAKHYDMPLPFREWHLEHVPHNI